VLRQEEVRPGVGEQGEVQALEEVLAEERAPGEVPAAEWAPVEEPAAERAPGEVPAAERALPAVERAPGEELAMGDLPAKEQVELPFQAPMPAEI